MITRLSLWYAASVGAITLNPWLGAILVDAGASDAGAATVLLAVPIGRIMGGPLWAWVADRTNAAVVLRWTTALSAALAAVLLLPLPAAWMAVAIGTFAVARAPVFPLADATTIGLLGRGYGPIRAVGSGAFLVAILAGGWLRHEVAGTGPVALAVGLLVITALLTWTFPPVQAAIRPPALRDAVRLLGHPRLWPLFAACVLHGAALSAYDQLFSVHIEQLGLPATTTGLALATGVTVEIVVLALGPRLLARFGALPVFTVGLAAGVPRFLITGWFTDPVVLIATQGLHGLHFGAYWVAGVALVAEEAPDGLKNTAQALLPATTFGAGALLGLGTGALLLQGDGDVALLYRVLAGASAAATTIVLVFARRAR